MSNNIEQTKEENTIDKTYIINKHKINVKFIFGNKSLDEINEEIMRAKKFELNII